mmetsp:Transcript_42130/g.78274  ORF Transcript_42130/g.78274 Transcript_42130/m.78274 type:complete len:282 (+) Transcript_42130:89-934(+)
MPRGCILLESLLQSASPADFLSDDGPCSICRWRAHPFKLASAEEMLAPMHRLKVVTSFEGDGKTGDEPGKAMSQTEADEALDELQQDEQQSLANIDKMVESRLVAVEKRLTEKIEQARETVAQRCAAAAGAVADGPDAKAPKIKVPLPPGKVTVRLARPPPPGSEDTSNGVGSPHEQVGSLLQRMDAVMKKLAHLPATPQNPDVAPVTSSPADLLERVQKIAGSLGVASKEHFRGLGPKPPPDGTGAEDSIKSQLQAVLQGASSVQPSSAGTHPSSLMSFM